MSLFRRDNPDRAHLVDIPVTIKHQTAKAWLVYSHNTGKQAWVPKSVSEYDGEVLTIPEIMAEEKGLI